jgi:hypothetical protein
MTTIKEVNSAIMFGSWTDTELSSMIDAVRFAKASLQKQVKRSLSIGQAVKFNSAKRGMTMQGTVDKIAIKYVTVRTPQGLWKVPANMLEAA